VNLRRRVERLEKRLRETADGRCPVCGGKAPITWVDLVTMTWARRQGEPPPPVCRCEPPPLDPVLRDILARFDARHGRDAGGA